MKKKSLCGIILVSLGTILLLSAAYGALVSIKVPSDGNIVTLQPYWNVECTNATTRINWTKVNSGQGIAPNSSLAASIWLKNFGSNAVTLNMTTANWNPAHAPSYIQVSWNREGYNLGGRASIECVLTLTVAADITTANPPIGDFAFDIVVTGTW